MNSRYFWHQFLKGCCHKMPPSKTSIDGDRMKQSYMTIKITLYKHDFFFVVNFKKLYSEHLLG